MNWKRLICGVIGHKWDSWFATVFWPDGVRYCQRCKIDQRRAPHVSNPFNPPNRPFRASELRPQDGQHVLLIPYLQVGTPSLEMYVKEDDVWVSVSTGEDLKVQDGDKWINAEPLINQLRAK